MSFLWRDVWWLLALVPVLAVLGEYLLRRRQAVQIIRFSSISLVSPALRQGTWFKSRLPPLLVLIGLCGLVAASARPTVSMLVPALRGTVIVAIDVSISMAATDVTPTRLAAAQAAVVDFVGNLPAGVRVGIVAFGGHAVLIQSPTSDKASVVASLGRMTLQDYTAIGTGILAAASQVCSSSAFDGRFDLFAPIAGEPRIWAGYAEDFFPPGTKQSALALAPIDPSTLIVLVSDGKSVVGVPAERAATIAASCGLRVFTIGVGTPYGGTVDVPGMASILAEFEEEQLQAIASATRAKYFHASDRGKLRSIYAELASSAILQKGESEISAIVVALAGALLLFAAGLSLTWFP